LITSTQTTESGLEPRERPRVALAGSGDAAITILNDSLNYANTIISTLREPFLVLDKDLRVRSANDAFYKFFRVTAQETEDQIIGELGNRQWSDSTLLASLTEVLTKDQPIDDFEVDYSFAHIGRKVMRLNARRVNWVANYSELILLAIEDVTERRGSQIALAFSEARYRRLFEAAQDSILMLDVQTGVIVDANPFIQRLLGYTRDELVGRELWQIGCFVDIEESRRAFRVLLETGYIRYENLPLKGKDGRQIEVEFVSNVYQEGDKRIVQCNIRDITARRRLEHQSASQALELADLHRRKDEFLAMLSHELRNPLSAIFSAMHIMRLQSDQNPIQLRARAVLERQVGQISSLINDLLEVSRVITGRIQLNAERLDLRGVVEHAVAAMRPSIDKRKHHLTVLLPELPVWLVADAARLEQVVVNLLNNAAKYTDERGDLFVTLESNDAQAILRVRDTGMGIAPELLAKIFDLFTQADRSLDRSQGGLGIGLSLVRKLVELHHGTVTAQSKGLNRGSEFTVTLPVDTSVLDPLTLASLPEKIASDAKRILVADDNSDAADMIAISLRMSGHEVKVVYSGQSTLDMAATYRPEFVILDIGLPDISGYHVAERLRSNPQTKDAYLIALTGYGQEADRELTRRAGFDHHLVKPAGFDEIEEILSTLGQSARSKSEGNQPPRRESA
jgi:PAS domain S-box-containing protein